VRQVKGRQLQGTKVYLIGSGFALLASAYYLINDAVHGGMGNFQ